MRFPRTRCTKALRQGSNRRQETYYKRNTDSTHPINAIVDAIKSSRLGISQGEDRLWDACEEAGLVYQHRIEPSQVGVDPCNQDSIVINVEDTLTLLDGIKTMGWSWALCAHAKCVEIIPGDSAVEDFTAAASGHMAPVEPDIIRFGSVTCSHTNMGLRAIAANMKCDNTQMSRGGRFCVHALRESDPSFVDAVEHGLEWKVLKWRVRIEFPEVLEIIALAGKSRLPRQIHEVQGLSALHRGLVNARAKVCWRSLKASVLRTQPVWTGDVDALIVFCVSKAGGVEGQMLHNFKAWHAQYVNAEIRRVPGEVYGALATTRWQYCAYAVLKAAYTCPIVNLFNGVCEWITRKDIDREGKYKHRAKWAAAEKMLREAWRFFFFDSRAWF